MNDFDTAMFVMFCGGITATLGVQWITEKLEGWAKEEREPITFTFDNIMIFLGQDQSQFIQGDTVILRNNGKTLKRFGNGWIPLD